MQKMNIVYKRLDELRPYENNAKTHPESQLANIAHSIENYGWKQPVVIDPYGVIIVGHGRVQAAQRSNVLRDQLVPCIIADDLTEEEIAQFRIVDNKSAESPWDMDALAAELEKVDLSGFDFDFGFEDKLSAEVVEDNYVPQLPEKPKARAGDVYQLGRHRLMCGDSTKREDVEKLCAGAQMDLLLTDPPYNVDYEGAAGKIKNDHMASDKFREFLTAAFRNAATVMKPGAGFYIWHADSEGYNFRGACMDSKFQIRQCLIWVKNAHVMGRQDFQWKHEPCLFGEREIEEDEIPLGDETQPCLYGWKDGARHYFFKNRKQSTVLEFPKPIKSKEHPMMKPVRLFDYQMQCSTHTGDSVLDLFAGSGTTIIAAEQNGRRAYCMEFDPHYVDVIIDRWEKFTGERAVLLNE